MEFALRYIVGNKKRRIRGNQLFSRILKEMNPPNEHVALMPATLYHLETSEIMVQLVEPLQGRKA